MTDSSAGRTRIGTAYLLLGSEAGEPARVLRGACELLVLIDRAEVGPFQFEERVHALEFGEHRVVVVQLQADRDQGPVGLQALGFLRERLLDRLPVLRKQRSGHLVNISSLGGVVGFKHCAAYSASKFAVEGLSQAVAAEVERFGIKITVVEPGFFRTELLDAKNVRWPRHRIEDYAAEGDVQATWSAYDGTQQGDPEKLGRALVQIAGMKTPPRQFHAGSDALAVIKPALAARLQEIQDHEELSKSTDGAS